jgi:hypothetical protein
MFRSTLFILLLCLLAGPTLAAENSGDARAKDKKLAGAALTSFVTKCEKDAKASCDATAKAKNLHGAAETSFTTKCVKDAVGH